MNKPNSELNKSTTEGWETINWRKVERYVFKQQKRIYAASRQGDKRQVRQLQKTLMNSWSNKVLAVRRVTQDNRGKKTAGVDGVKSLSPEARIRLTGQLKLTGKSKPTRRVWIPKPGKDEKRPLGIPTIYDRALQGVVKAALEPEWEALFEASSYGFRPGRSCHDAIRHIKNSIQSKAKYVLDADIAKCFDRINHNALLHKLNQKGKVRRQVKSWLKSGVIDQKVFAATKEGTPQGGVCSPLLANIALHGLSQKLETYISKVPLRYPNGRSMKKEDKINSLTYIRYADDFVVLHSEKAVILKCREIISQWLSDIGLELKPEKTRLTHTLQKEESEDGIAGFNFLGFNIIQRPAGKYISARNTKGQVLGFNTFITPTKESVKKHLDKIGETLKAKRNAPQGEVIATLNPIIRGWTNYYKFSDAKTCKILKKIDHLTYLKLRRWGKRKCKSIKNASNKYWHKIGVKKWVFSVIKQGTKAFRLLEHDEVECSSNSYVKVKGNSSPYDGNLVYWSTRMGRYPDTPNRKARLFCQQKGICLWCNLKFREDDIIEEDHILALALGGKDEWKNLQLLHGHCHDEKTVLDLMDIRDKNIAKYFSEVNNQLSKISWQWIDDCLVVN